MSTSKSSTNKETYLNFMMASVSTETAGNDYIILIYFLSPINNFVCIADVVLTCRMPSCNFLAACVPRLLSHYRTTHRCDSDFHVPCMYLNCDRIFNSESNLKKHYDKAHKIVHERTTTVDPLNLLEVDDDQTDNFDQTRTGTPPDGDTQPYHQPLTRTDAPISTLYVIYISFIPRM